MTLRFPSPGVWQMRNGRRERYRKRAHGGDGNREPVCGDLALSASRGKRGAGGPRHTVTVTSSHWTKCH